MNIFQNPTRPSWTKIGDNTYSLSIGDQKAVITYKPKEVKSGVWENHWLFTAKLGHTTWFEHPVDATHIDTAQKVVEELMIKQAIKELKYYTACANEFALLLSNLINGDC